MKRIFILALLLAGTIGVAACGGSDDHAHDGDAGHAHEEAEAEHAHEGEEAHSHEESGPETEAYYGDESEPATDEEHANDGEHGHSDEDGDHEH